MELPLPDLPPTLEAQAKLCAKKHTAEECQVLKNQWSMAGMFTILALMFGRYLLFEGNLKNVLALSGILFLLFCAMQIAMYAAAIKIAAKQQQQQQQQEK